MIWMEFIKVQTARSNVTEMLRNFVEECKQCHGLLDAMTNGGRGIALLSPVSNQRYFLPWTPIEVSPLGVRGFFNARGLAVMQSEIVWIWLPAACMLIVGWVMRRFMPGLPDRKI